MGNGLHRAFNGLFGSKIYDSEKALGIIKDYVKKNDVIIKNRKHAQENHLYNTEYYQENQINEKSAIVLPGNLQEQINICNKILKDNIDTAKIHKGEDNFNGQIEINTGNEYYYYYDDKTKQFYKTNTFIVYTNTKDNFHMTGFGGDQVDL